MTWWQIALIAFSASACGAICGMLGAVIVIGIIAERFEKACKLMSFK